jgi:CRISPR-associated protein Cmr1
MRAAPSKNPASVTRREEWSQKVPVELITRLFGGGARPKEVDEASWLRPSAAKSALRGWWRAGNAHRFLTLEALRAEEDRLFGSAATYGEKGQIFGGPGVLQVQVKVGKAPTLEEYNAPPGSPLNGAYFAGAIQPPHAKLGLPGATAEILVRIPEHDPKEILESMRIWLTLGGAGSRTRRGAGALAVTGPKEARDLGLPVTLEDLEKTLLNWCHPQEVPGALEGVFCLARTRRIFFGPLCSSAEEAQRVLLAALREARQDRPHPDTWNGPMHWGRSRWPEADAIRLKTGRHHKDHRPEPANAGKYPRAALGLPIVVHYKDSGEPEEHRILALRGETKLERYTSPILLRPIRVWVKEQKRYLPVAIFTACILPEDSLPLVVLNKQQKLDSEDISRGVVQSYDIRRNAPATLLRVENVFTDPQKAPGFRSIL